MREDFVDRRLARNPIAIVGMSGLFPMARSHREFWQHIVDGTDCTQEVPESRWRLDDYHDSDPATPDKTYARRGGFIPDVEFDPLEFGLPATQLDVTSTMQLLSLGVARDLLADAGAPESGWYDPSATGVVLGVSGVVPLAHSLSARLSTPVIKEVVRSCGLSTQDAEEIADRYAKAFPPWEENSFPGLLANVAAGRVANRLGLGGMNCTVDAACAASLAAIRLAVAELTDGRADMMIAGGVDTQNTVFMYLCFSKVGALSHSDRISPLSDRADGTMLGEGIGMIGLRRLADAERDGNRIYAVLRGIGSSSDGRAGSIYAPMAKGQRAALDRAYADAECSPESVELFEAHATGTVVGDRTELTALGDLLQASSKERQFAAVGSVKSQIGHTKSTAGTASLMKVAFALHQKTLPGTINVDALNDRIDVAEAPFYVNVRTRPWILDPDRPVRRAALSSMGFGGTNFHFVLQEHETERAPRVLHRPAMAHLWHAPDSHALLALLLEDAPPADGGEIPAGHARIGFVSRDDEHSAEQKTVAIEQLRAQADADEWEHPRGVFFRRRAIAEPKVGALFAGQGSQYVEMGLTAVLNNPVVADAFDRANATFAGADVRLAKIVFPPPAFDSEVTKAQEADLRRTEYAQPGIGALSVGQFRCLSEFGLECAAFAGHSFGELTALWAAGALTLDDYFALATARGRAMAPSSSDGDPGTMVALEADRDQVADLLAGFETLRVCNHNATDQIVVGGGSDEISRLIQECGDRRVVARRLPVSAAFHTPHVAHAVEAFRPAVEAVRIGEPAAPVYANAPGAGYGDDAEANAQTLVRQLLEPVEFVDVLERMRDAGVTVFVEFGPKQVLGQFVRRTLGNDVHVISADAGPHGDSDVALKQAALKLAVLGVALSGLNRNAEPAAEPPAPGAMSVTISAQEYESDGRRRSYREALQTPYRTPDAPTRATILENPVSNPVDQHLAVHSQYLESQLRVGEQLAHALGRPIDAQTVQAMAAIARQSEAIGQAHTRAGEILAALAGLESGSAVPAAWTANGDQKTGAQEIVVDNGIEAALPVAPIETSFTETSWTEAPRIEVAVTPPPSEAPAPDDLGALVVEVIAEKTGYPAGMLDRSMDLETDLGIDSIKRVQVMSAVHERAPGAPQVGAEQLGELRTIDQLVAFLAGGADPKAREAGALTHRHVVDLARLPVIDVIDRPYREDPVAVVLDRGEGEPLAAALIAQGWKVRREFDTLADDVDLCLAVIGAEEDWTSSRQHLVETILFAKRAAALPAPSGGRTAFVIVTRLDGALGLSGAAGPVSSLVGGVGGVVKTLAAERPDLFCRVVDVSPELTEAQLVDVVLEELQDAAVDTAEVGIDRTGGRWTVVPGRYGPAQRVSPVGPMPAEVGLIADDLLVVTGGARGVTAECVRALAARTEARFLLLGRTELDAEPDWAAGVADAELLPALLASSDTRSTPVQLQRMVDDVLGQREIRKTVAALGGRGRYLAVDISDAVAVTAALSEYRDEITGLVHGAGVLADAKLTDKTVTQIDRVFAPKLDGLRNVLDALDEDAVRHLVVFTSVAGLLGNPGQADYAVANEALCRFVAGWRRSHPGAHVTAIDWTAWNAGMVDAGLRELFAARGIPLLDPKSGARAFVEQFTAARRDDLRVLIGEDAALGGDPIVPAPAFSTGRILERITEHPILQAHWIDSHVVLPATFALGWMINVLERAHPGLCVVHAEDFEVHKGILFDSAAHGGHRVDVEAGYDVGDQVVVRAVVRTESAAGLPIPRYGATFVLAASPAAPPSVAVPVGPGEDTDVYRNATLFHGPPLQGIRKVLEHTENRMALLCQLPDARVGDGAYHGRLHSPVLADVVLQSPAPLGRELTGDVSLPLAIGKADWFAPLPDDEPFVLLVENARVEHGTFRVTVTAATVDGLVLQRFSDIMSAGTNDLAEMFRAAVLRWTGPLGEVSAVKPLARTTRTRLDHGDLVRLTAGDIAGVFGPAYGQDGLNPDVRLASELVLAEVTSMRYEGNGRGRLRARCVPGADVVEATTQAAEVFALYFGLQLCLPDAEFVRMDETLLESGDVGTELEVEVEQIDLIPRPWVRVRSRSALVTLSLSEKPGTPIGPEAGGRPSTWLGRKSPGGERVLLSEFHMNHFSRGDQGIAFGPEFARYDGRRTTRLPGGGLTLVDRIVSVDGERGKLAGTSYVTEYDSPADAWYYADSANHSAPNCVHIETAGQAALTGGYYLGATLSTSDETLSLRNLGGTATVLREIDLRNTTIRQHTELVSTDAAPGSILQDFRFTQFVHGQPYYSGEMMFGYFSDRALGSQAGLDGGRSVPTWLEAERPRSGVRTIDVAARRADPRSRLCSRRHLALLDEVTVVDGGGRHGAGYLYAERSFDPDFWLFDWHFPLDPVMPGSFGIESVIQAMQEWLLDTEPARRLRAPDFVLPVGQPFTWKYRGQFLPTDGMSSLEVHVKRVETRPGRLRMTADASMWKPGLRIYELTDVAVELREKGAQPW